MGCIIKYLSVWFPSLIASFWGEFLMKTQGRLAWVGRIKEDLLDEFLEQLFQEFLDKMWSSILQKPWKEKDSRIHYLAPLKFHEINKMVIRHLWPNPQDKNHERYKLGKNRAHSNPWDEQVWGIIACELAHNIINLKRENSILPELWLTLMHHTRDK